MRYVTIASLLILGSTTQAVGQTGPAPSNDAVVASRTEMRELIEAMQATAKASRENVDYARVVPDLLYQILTKLDKIEDKLDKVETTLKATQASASKKR
ncbi:hypothetical protein [Microvirga sp. VF16]|uniref:hypothetical protein n=1 Tax=Microvirga sp. VF16 TaxID=2807101 RepID=UPI00193C9D92|nr:hypothetical protein [Microvirga sp. VF16]QRM28547.1 hypothetical protein JO965_20300 [Microvirga sp. VF16]